MRELGTEVLVIGGGATGAGVARDAAMRGFKTVLVEKGDLSHGTTGRYHGLLHSGGRYAVADPQTAHDCIVENQALRRIMTEAIEDTGGFFVQLPGDDPIYADRWVAACLDVGIPVEEIPPTLAFKEAPLLNPEAERVFRVPDAACDSFDALHALARGIRVYGGIVWTRHCVEALIVRDRRVRGARVRDLRTSEQLLIRADVVINAAGPWAGQIAAMADCAFAVELDKGTMLAYSHRLSHTILNRCAMPGDGDIMVPVGTVSVIGTTSARVDDPDQYDIEAWETRRLRQRAEELIPVASESRLLRAWAGVRPLFGDRDSSSDGRAASRSHRVIDHATRDGVGGFISVVGGKFTTYRLMAEEAVDLLCRKVGTIRPCRTAEEPLPGSASQRYVEFGARYAHIDQAPSSGAIVCECELVTRPQLEAAAQSDEFFSLDDLRRDLRLGMGPCQGAFCAVRAAGVLCKINGLAPEQVNAMLLDFLRARWKGIRPIATGHTARQAALNLRLYRDLLALDRLPCPSWEESH